MADLGSAYVYGLGAGSVNREDVMNAIINVDPFDTPLLNMAPKVPVSHTTVEWLEHTLPATSTAGRPEGQAFTQDTIDAPARRTNITAIFGKHIVVSETQQVVSPYGFSDTFMYEIGRQTKAVMRNIENRLFAASDGSAAGEATSASAAGTARAFKTLQDFITTNRYHCNSSALIGGAGVTASAASLTERAVNSLLQLIYSQGGNPNFLFVPPATKRVISSFDGSISSAAATKLTLNLNAAEQQISRSINSLLTDFGLVNVVMDRWVPQAAITATNNTNDLDGCLFALELPKIQIGFLRPIRFKKLAEDGDRVRGMVIGELTLKVLAQKAHGRLFGIDNRV